MTPEAVVRLAWGGWVASWWAAAMWSDRAVKRPPVHQEIGYRALAVAGAILLFGLYQHAPGAEGILWRNARAAEWLWVAATIAGLAFTWWARLHLGRLWSSSVTRKAEHRVIDTGPYAIVRHPIYTGISLAGFATAAMRGTALAFAGAGLMMFGWYIKARLEERFLRDQLGADAYDAYARRVPMLIPFPRSRA